GRREPPADPERQGLAAGAGRHRVGGMDLEAQPGPRADRRESAGPGAGAGPRARQGRAGGGRRGGTGSRVVKKTGSAGGRKALRPALRRWGIGPPPTSRLRRPRQTSVLVAVAVGPYAPRPMIPALLLLPVLLAAAPAATPSSLIGRVPADSLVRPL